MKIAILGAGRIGMTAARLFAAAGYDVVIANSRGPETLADLVDELGSRVRAATVADAIAAGDAVLLAVPWWIRDRLPADRLAGKLVIDAMNAYRRDFTPDELPEGLTSSQVIAGLLPGARVVKAFNTYTADKLGSAAAPDRPLDEREPSPYAGDDADAKRRCAELIAAIGFKPVDRGGLADAP